MSPENYSSAAQRLETGDGELEPPVVPPCMDGAVLVPLAHPPRVCVVLRSHEVKPVDEEHVLDSKLPRCFSTDNESREWRHHPFRFHNTGHGAYLTDRSRRWHDASIHQRPATRMPK